MNDLYLGYLILSLAVGSLCYTMAKEKGLKYPVVWFISGIIFSFVALALISVIKKRLAKTK